MKPGTFIRVRDHEAPVPIYDAHGWLVRYLLPRVLALVIAVNNRKTIVQVLIMLSDCTLGRVYETRLFIVWQPDDHIDHFVEGRNPITSS